MLPPAGAVLRIRRPDPVGGSGRRRRSSKLIQDARSDRFLEFLGGPERDFLARFELDRLAGGRVAAHASGALADLKDAEAADADAVALLQVLHDKANKLAKNRLRLLLRHLVSAGQGGGQMLQGNGWC